MSTLPEGFEVPIHRSLTQPQLMAGAPREITLINGTLSTALVLGLHSVYGVPVGLVLHLIAVAVTKRGFDPDAITVPAKQPVTLVFTRKTEETCTKSVVITLDDGKTLERELPLDKPVEIAVTFPKAGKLGYACSMGMSKGTIVVQ